MPARAPGAEPVECPRMSIWFSALTAESLQRIERGGFATHIGILFTDVGADYLCAALEVTPEVHQPYGVLHGGVSAALAETVGSVAANLCVDAERFMCLGQELNANHLRPVSRGRITATARPFHIGHRSQVWSIEIHDARTRLVCVSRLTMAVVPRRASAP